MLGILGRTRDHRRGVRLQYRAGCSRRRMPPAASPATTSTALRRLVADPEADPADTDLVGQEERRFQLEQLAGPERPRPQRRFHELFEERVRQHPERIAAVQDAREWTYAELNARANRIARGSARARAARGGHRGSRRRTGSGVDGRCHRHLQGRRRIPADRAALPGRPNRQNAHAGRGPGGAHRRRQHHHPRRGTGRNACSDEALVRGHRGRGASRRRPRHGGSSRSARLRLFHLRVHWRAERRDVRARRHGEPPVRQDRGPGDPPRGRRRPDRTPVLRHLAVATGLGAARRRPHTHRRAGPDPRRRAVHRHGGTGRGGGLPGRSVVSGRRGGVPGRQASRPCRTSAASRPQGRL